MKIKYIHKSEPKKTKIHNTIKAKKNNTFLRVTQKEFDDFTLKRMEKDKADGLILSYEIMED